MLTDLTEISSKKYFYDLPNERIASFPLANRSDSKLLVYEKGEISENIFKSIDEYIEKDSMLICNNTKVIQARLHFINENNKAIEILCLEPTNVSGYDSLNHTSPSNWKCMVGNLKHYKSNSLSLEFEFENKKDTLIAIKDATFSSSSIIRFEWTLAISFLQVLECVGKIPLPPYIKRELDNDDKKRYQTVFADENGSVAAPTAALHFTKDVFAKLNQKNISIEHVTLHVGAGTFKPIKSELIADHAMHGEDFFVSKELLQKLANFENKITLVGTTSMRTMESVFVFGNKLLNKLAFDSKVLVEQWDAYRLETIYSKKQSVEAVLEYMEKNNLSTLHGQTKLMIVDGYIFGIANSLITNFHQPDSTLMLLVGACLKDNWTKVYDYALTNEFRFLSYGDSSILKFR